METWKKFVLIVVLIVGALLVYMPHYGSQYPLHVDEWNSISETKIAQNEGLQYLVTRPVESGFVFFLYILDLFFPLILIYKFLPLLNFVVVSLILFYFLNKKDYWIGIFAIMFFASLRSNVNVLGNWFFVPITFAAIFIYLLLFKLKEGFDKGGIYLIAFLLFLIAFIHPSSFLVLFLTVCVYYWLNYRKVLEKSKLFLPFLILLIPVFLIIYYFGDFSYLLSRLIWSPLVVQINFNPFLFYGLLSSFFAVYGFVLTYKKKELLGFRIYLMISLVSLVSFWFVGRILFSSYQRYLYHFMLAVVVFSAIGFYEFLRVVYSHFDRCGKELRVLILLILVFVTVFFVFVNYRGVYPGTELYKVIDKGDYDALMFLKNYDLDYTPHRSYLNSAQLISPRGPGTASYAIANRASVSSSTYYYRSFEEVGLSEEFFMKGCDFKKEVLDKYENILYVYSYEKIDCSFLEEIYGNDNVYLYVAVRD